MTFIDFSVYCILCLHYFYKSPSNTRTYARKCISAGVNVTFMDSVGSHGAIPTLAYNSSFYCSYENLLCSRIIRNTITVDRCLYYPFAKWTFNVSSNKMKIDTKIYYYSFFHARIVDCCLKPITKWNIKYSLFSFDYKLLCRDSCLWRRGDLLRIWV